ncbi:MAG: hypothetical protein E5Y69_19400 [Mesorhizobium sp.]|nr:MAG: hypothetical protein E5Y69_19400 [Mesorhizobium sp.]
MGADMNPKFLVVVAMLAPFAPANAHSDEYASAVFQVYGDNCSLDFLKNIAVQRPAEEDIEKIKRYFEGKYHSECTPFYKNEVYPREVHFQLSRWDIFGRDGSSVLNDKELMRFGSYLRLSNFAKQYECGNLIDKYVDDYGYLDSKLVSHDVESVSRYWIEFEEYIKFQTRMAFKNEMCQFISTYSDMKIVTVKDEKETIQARYAELVDTLVRDPSFLSGVLNGSHNSQFTEVGGSYQGFLEYVQETFGVLTIDLALFQKLQKHYYPDSSGNWTGLKIDEEYGPIDR